MSQATGTLPVEVGALLDVFEGDGIESGPDWRGFNASDPESGWRGVFQCKAIQLSPDEFEVVLKFSLYYAGDLDLLSTASLYFCTAPSRYHEDPWSIRVMPKGSRKVLRVKIPGSGKMVGEAIEELFPDLDLSWAYNPQLL